MKTAKKTILFLVVLSLALSLPATARAHWISDDGHKMHYPQPPNPDGWDIDMTTYVLADDWKCSEDGPVSDIHFWYSVEYDYGDVMPPHFAAVNVSIHDDVPAGANPTYSHPGTLRWSREFAVLPEMIAGPWEGYQGWDSPLPDSDCRYDDHIFYWQLNITDIDEPFIQEEGKIYWLDLQIISPVDESVGWKTTYQPFGDDAVYQTAAGAAPTWAPIAVCEDNQRRDLAFVITPEPATLLVLALGLIPALLRLRRRRKA